MKNKALKLIFALSLAAMQTMSCLAFETEISMSRSAGGIQQLKINVSKLAENEEALVRVFMPDADSEAENTTPSDFRQRFLYANQITADADGNAAFSVNFPSGTADGQVLAEVSGVNSDNVYSVMLPYKSIPSVNAVLEEIYNCGTDLQAAFDIAAENKLCLGIKSKMFDTFDALNCVPSNAVGVLTGKKYEFRDYAEYTEKIYDVLTLDAINGIKDPATYCKLLKRDSDISCAEELGLTGFTEELKQKRYEKFNSMTAAEANAVADRLIKQTNHAVDTFGADFEEAMFAASAQLCKNNDSLEELILESTDLLSNGSAFEELPPEKRAKAVTELFPKRTATSVSVFNADLGTAVENANKPEDGGNSGNGGSGGSGGGGGGGGTSKPVGGAAATAPGTTDTKPGKAETVDELVNPFADLDGYEWAKEAITVLYNNNVVTGKESNKFSPDDNVTRAELTKMAVLTFGFEDENCKSDFRDVGEDDWAYRYISYANYIGAVNGLESDYFGADEDITREQLITIIYRFFSHREIKPEEAAVYVPFDDDALISDYARDAVETLAAVGIVNGSDNQLKPKDKCSRAEAAKLLYNAYLRIMSR